MTFEDALPLLGSLAHQGELVPFIGSGASQPSLNGWQPFLLQLLKGLGLVGKRSPKSQKLTPAQMYRLAETAAMALGALPIPEQAEVVRSALRPPRSRRAAPLTETTKALAATYWPLVVSTNYDDLYAHAGRENQYVKRTIQICGRGRSDCHHILKSLDDDLPPILWAVQGYVGRNANPDFDFAEVRHLERLIDQVVIGHEQYVEATNGEPHFRRAFSEVFRRRSLLFVGSGLQEDYILSLFSEIVHHHGLGSNPHFALFHRTANVDEWFLRVKLGINVIRFKDYVTELPDLLKKIGKAGRWSRRNEDKSYTLPCPGADAAPCAMTYSLARIVRGTEVPALKVICELSNLGLPDAAQKEAAIVSVGRWKSRPLVGKFARGFIETALRGGIITVENTKVWTPLQPRGAFTFRLGKQTPIFAVCARLRGIHGKRHDRRDLKIIGEAVGETLLEVEKAGYTRVLMGAIASGVGGGLHPVHAFAEMLRGVWSFAKNSRGGLQCIRIQLVDPRVWAIVASGKLPVAQLLSSEVLQFAVEVHNASGEVENLKLMLRGTPSIETIVQHTRLQRKHWTIILSPPPTDENLEQEYEAKDSDGVTSTMRVIFKARSLAPPPSVASAASPPPAEPKPAT